MLKNSFGEESYTTVQYKSPLEQPEAFSFPHISCNWEKTQTPHLKSSHSEPDQRTGVCKN